ncbi:IclR family transcriptional regulator [Actinomadura verrucosospora]|uniref:IclR family transcriptional regulator n=1 Tax=Actinomadura verrucosospora TaxID=46165 RepID=A0A7D4A4B8_ACTVE|nr:IclR family transcriptional regulator [Actinomadura verrucosospora]QKG20227.1 IclR family transcriptional regulator [Actinomadura verrucosospora]
MPRPAGSAVDKALDLIESTVRAGRPLRLSELAGETGMHRATAYRILVDLVRRGWIMRSEDRYLPGPVVLRFSQAAAGGPLAVLGRPVLQSLSDGTGMMANLQVLEPEGGRVIDAVRPPRLAMFTDLLGELLPIHTFAGPMALVSALDEAARVPYLRAAEQQGHPRAGLLEDVERTRRTGFALQRGRNDEVIASLSRAVLGGNGRPLCAITVVGLDREFDDPALAGLREHLAAATAELERVLAGPDEGPGRD